MGKIKSALELAMEKTADMAIDRDMLKQKELIRKGQILASSILNKSEKDGAAKLQTYKGKDLIYVKKGMGETLLSNIRLPLYLNSEDNLPIIKETFSLISKKEEIYSLVFSQLKELFEKFLDDIQNLTEGLKQQYMPVLRQKQQQLMQQTGQNVQLEPEQDPEFLEILSKNRKALEDQYNNVIAQAKAELIKII
ncbi:MAG: hypothetical protein JEY91_13890 [Spirochaetaceae bacterium]|nr:hypothetical protein [Spirochaetaceae bacterium]